MRAAGHDRRRRSDWRSPGSRTRSVRACQGLRPRRVARALAMARPCVLPSADRTASAPGSNFLRGSMAGLHVPLSTLRVAPRDATRMTRGQHGSLHLCCEGLAPLAPCRSPGAPDSNLSHRLSFRSGANNRLHHESFHEPTETCSPTTRLRRSTWPHTACRDRSPRCAAALRPRARPPRPRRAHQAEFVRRIRLAHAHQPARHRDPSLHSDVALTGAAEDQVAASSLGLTPFGRRSSLP